MPRKRREQGCTVDARALAIERPQGITAERFVGDLGCSRAPSRYLSRGCRQSPTQLSNACARKRVLLARREGRSAAGRATPDRRRSAEPVR
jgi:hypothetical protein